MDEVKDDGHYIANFAYGGSDTSYIWPELKEDQASALYLDANFEKAFKIDDVSSVFHYELITQDGGLNTCMSGEGKGEIRCTEFNQMLHEDELTNLPLAVSISHSSEDNFLDVDFAKVPDLDCEFCDELSGGNLRSEIHSPGSSNDEVGVSGSSIIEPRCFTDQSGTTFKYERPVKDINGFQHSLTSNTQDVSKTDIINCTLDIGCSLSHNGKKTHFSASSVKESCFSMTMTIEDEVGSESQCTEVSNFCVDDESTDSGTETNVISTRQRRMCRPPQRYLDGSPWLKSTLHTEKKQGLGARSQKKHWGKGLKRKMSTIPARNWEFDSDEEYEPDESSFNVRKSRSGDRRKNSKPWTYDEVVVLVDGMSKFGTGQWTAVKNAFFSSSRRTATDIRDKWRNLVKTNCKGSRSKKDDQNTRNGTQPLPQSLVEQVREIAKAPKSSSKRGQRLYNKQTKMR